MVTKYQLEQQVYFVSIPAKVIGIKICAGVGSVHNRTKYDLELNIDGLKTRVYNIDSDFVTV